MLARELRAARQAETRDGIRRVFHLTAEQVRAEVPAYGHFVDDQVARLGRSHPMVRSQFFSEEIDFASGLFTPARLSLMVGNHPAQSYPDSGKTTPCWWIWLVRTSKFDKAASLETQVRVWQTQIEMQQL